MIVTSSDMSLTPEEYIVDVLTLLALNATASATANLFNTADDDDDNDGDAELSTNQESAFYVVLTASDIPPTTITNTTTPTATTPTMTSPTMAMANIKNASSIINHLLTDNVTASGFTNTYITDTTTSAATTPSTPLVPPTTTSTAASGILTTITTSVATTITSSALQLAANLTATSPTTPTATGNTNGRIRYNADIWLIPCYSIILLFAIVGNVLVIMTLIQNRRMRTITNVFLLNLAISDILLGVLCMPVTLVGTLLRHFIFGEVLCKLFQFSQAASVAVSSWTLVAISCERYYAICHPLRSRTWQTLSHAYKIIAFIWLGSVVCMMPIAIYSQLIPTSRQGMRKCREQWPKDALAYERSYNLFLDLILLILPLMVLCAAYILITRTLYVSMQNERAINFGNSGSGSSPAIMATATANTSNIAAQNHHHPYPHHQYHHHHYYQQNGGNGKFHTILEPSFTSTTTTAATETLAASNGKRHNRFSSSSRGASFGFSTLFRWNYRGNDKNTTTTTTASSTTIINGISHSSTNSGIMANGSGIIMSSSSSSSSSSTMGRCRSDLHCRRIVDELPSHANCAKQFYYYEDLSNRSVGFGGIAHKRKQLTTPQNRQRHHSYAARATSMKSSLKRCGNDNCYGCGCDGGGTDEQYMTNGRGNSGSIGGHGQNICYMAATTTTALKSTSTSPYSSISSPTTASAAATTATLHIAQTAMAAHTNQTMIVTNLTTTTAAAQQQQTLPQRFKLYSGLRQQETGGGGGGERYKMVTTTTTPGMRMIDTTLRRTNTTKNLESKRRVVKMMFVLVLEFFICWTPLYVINTAAMFIGPSIYEYVDYTSISFFQLLAYSSSCCNPITYCFMNASFRRAFLDTFRGGLQWRRGRFKRHRRSKTETSLSAAGNSITLANSGATLMTTNTLLDSPRL